MRSRIPYSVVLLAVAGLLLAAALGAAAHWVAGGSDGGLSQRSVVAGELSPATARGPAASAVTDTPVLRRARGRSVFTRECAGCHTLGAAGATGTLGPDLDRLSPPASAVRAQVATGGRGMPAFGGVLSDVQIRDVAAYVAAVATSPAPATTRPSVSGGGGGSDGSSGRGRGRGSDDGSSPGKGRDGGGGGGRDD